MPFGEWERRVGLGIAGCDLLPSSTSVNMVNLVDVCERDLVADEGLAENAAGSA